MINNKLYGLLGLATKAGKLAFGTDSCLDLINKHKLKLVIVASDSSDRTKQKMQQKCIENNIAFYIYGTKFEISNAIGKVNKGVIGIKDKNFTDAIEKIINGGDVIG